MLIVLRIIKLAALTAALAFFGLVVGLMVVILPPLAWIGVVAFTGLILLWVMPDLPHLPERLLYRLFLFAVVVQFTIPTYYAILVQGLPWISLRRVSWLMMLMPAALMLAASSQTRSRVVASMRDALPITLPMAGFLVCVILSLFTSIAWTESLRSLWEALLYWGMAFFVVLICIRSEADVARFVQLFCVLATIAGVLGFAEFALQDHFLLSIWPQSMIDRLAADNPSMFSNISRGVFRNGEFRASYIYYVSLSYGEFMSICSPLAAAVALHGRTWRLRILGVVGLFASILGIYASGSRGAYLSLAVSLVFVTSFWIIRYMREQPNSLVGGTATAIFLNFVFGFVALAAVWKPLRWRFTGGYEGAGSTNVRWLQWELATPSILANPFTGYGFGIGGLVVGYFTPAGTPSVDSYIITLLVDTGVPGLLCFFGMIFAAVILLTQSYLRDSDPRTIYSIALAGALLSFAIYRLALSQLENHVFAFMLLGMSVVQVAAARRRASAQSRRTRGGVPVAKPLAAHRAT